MGGLSKAPQYETRYGNRFEMCWDMGRPEEANLETRAGLALPGWACSTGEPKTDLGCVRSPAPQVYEGTSSPAKPGCQKKKCISPQSGAREKLSLSCQTSGRHADRAPELTAGSDQCRMEFFGPPRSRHASSQKNDFGLPDRRFI